MLLQVRSEEIRNVEVVGVGVGSRELGDRRWKTGDRRRELGDWRRKSGDRRRELGVGRLMWIWGD